MEIEWGSGDGGFVWELDARARTLAVRQKRHRDRHHNRVGPSVLAEREYDDVAAAVAAGVAAAQGMGIELRRLAIGDYGFFTIDCAVSMARTHATPLDWVRRLELRDDTRGRTLSRVACRRMPQLEELHVVDSRWQYLPMEIGSLQRLRTTRIWVLPEAEILIWPPSMGRLRHLDCLDINRSEALYALREASMRLPVAERAHAVFHDAFARAPQAAAYAMLALARRRRMRGRVPRQLVRAMATRLLDTANLPCWARVTLLYSAAVAATAIK